MSMDRVIGTLWGLLLCALVTLLFSCTKTEYVTVPEYHFVDRNKTLTIHDSVFVGDTVFVREYTQGDSVYREKVKTRLVYKWRDRHDTVTVVKRDSVAKPVIVEKKTVEYKYQTHWYDSVCRVLTALSLVIFLVWRS